MSKPKRLSQAFFDMLLKGNEPLPEPTPMETHQEEAVAMETFKTRVSVSRNSMLNPHGFTQRAIGFDYINWKPYASKRVNYNADEFENQARALAPYVRCVVVSGCQGQAEKRWAAMSESPDDQSRDLSVMPSRATSRDNLIGQ